MKSAIFIIIAVVLALTLTGCVFQLAGHITGDTYADAGRYAAGDFTYDAGDVDAVELCWRTGSVEIVESDAAVLSVTESGKNLDEEAQVHSWLDGRTLRIQFCASGTLVRVQGREKHLTLEIPKGAGLFVYNTAADIHAQTLEQDSVFVSSHSGSFTCGSMDVSDANISSSSGRVAIDRITGGDLTVSTTSGPVDIGDAALTDTVICGSTSGSVGFAALRADEAVITTTSGSVTLGVLDCPCGEIGTTSGSLRLALPDAGARVWFSSTSGRLKTDLTYAVQGDVCIFGDGENELTVTSTSGSLTIE